ncbi:MAG: nitroreductase family protein [Candidatus Aminicenantes bacterium]|nr:nitroreductase family protein [Candidatus Aminicenantes bacterium]
MSEKTPFQALIEQRRSIRRFLPTPVEKEKILSCLEAARVAPSAENAQTWRFLVVDDSEAKDRLAKAAFSGIYRMTQFAAQAPVLVLVLAKLDILANRLGKQIQGVPFFMLDLGIAGEHFVLQAEELGLGTCWIGWFNMRAARKEFRIPRKYKIVSLFALGYPASRPAKDRVRKPLEEIAWFNKFGP